MLKLRTDCNPAFTQFGTVNDQALAWVLEYTDHYKPDGLLSGGFEMHEKLDAILAQGQENGEKLDTLITEQQAFTSIMRDAVLPAMLTVKELLDNILDALDDEEGGAIQDALEAILKKLDAVAVTLDKQPKAVADRVLAAMNGG